MHESGMAHELTERLQASELKHNLQSAFGDRVVVSRDDSDVFCYTDTREQAERAEELIRTVADGHGWELETELQRWHPTAEMWESPDAALPSTEAEQAEEHAERLAADRSEAEAQGYADFEVRVQLAHHHDAVALADRLTKEGLPLVRRWKYLLVGASDETTAEALAERLKAEAPVGSTVSVEGTRRTVFEEGPSNPFAIFGGMGG
jgi:hypothetical protein